MRDCTLYSGEMQLYYNANAKTSMLKSGKYVEGRLNKIRAFYTFFFLCDFFAGALAALVGVGGAESLTSSMARF